MFTPLSLVYFLPQGADFGLVNTDVRRHDICLIQAESLNTLHGLAGNFSYLVSTMSTDVPESGKFFSLDSKMRNEKRYVVQQTDQERPNFSESQLTINYQAMRAKKKVLELT